MNKQETSYTPGPWKTQTHIPLDRLEIQDAGGRRIAVRAMDFQMSAKTHDANARLIAAAPELLAALKRLRDDVQTAHVGADERCKDCAVCWSLELADAAIAKAEGRAEK